MINLKAKNNEDLKVIASLIQDAILPIGDFAYFKQDNKIIFALNRYCWETKKEKQRVNSVLTILNVDKIQTNNINMIDRKQSLYLLDICKEEENIILSFADNKKMKIKTSDLNVTIADVDELWSVEVTPEH